MSTTTIHHGDCIEVMRTLPESSVDSIVTDPPYNLSSGKKRDLKCIRQVVAEILLPNDDNGNTQRVESGDLPIPSLLGPLLSGEGGTTGIDTRIGVPEGSVDLQGATVAQHEVNAGNEPSTLASDEMLPSEGDAKAGQLVGNFILQLADGIDAPFCDGTCSCFTEPSAGVIAVAVVAPRLASCDGSSVGLVVEGNRVVRAADDAGREPKGATGVHAGGRAVDRFMLRLDLRGGTGELVPAGGALDGLPLFELVSAESVGAGARASRLSPMAKPYRVGLVDGSAGGTFTLYHVAHIKHSITGGFMGKEWDGWDNPASFQRWVTAWARECLRVLKPGGHLLAFGGTRTWHRLAVAVEDAGFEIRDSIAWLYGSGMPKGPATLKPAFEPMVLARKPFKGTLRANIAESGTGALSIDAARIPTTDSLGGGGATTPVGEGWDRPFRHDPEHIARLKILTAEKVAKAESLGRYPANVILDSSEAARLGYESRFFYIAKAAKSERPLVNGITHPTVKPLALMRWLVRLVTPEGGTVLEPFAGSGTTVEACLLEGFNCIAIEREAEYLPLIQARIDRQVAA